MRWIRDRVLWVICVVTCLSAVAVQAQPAGDCNNDGIPDDLFGLGRVFFDTFSWTTIDSNKWTVIWGATVDDVGISEPTEPYALRLNGHPYGGDSIESIPIDLTAATDLVLTYSWQRTGGGESPESGEDLFIEFADEIGTWITLAQYLGSGLDMPAFEQEILTLPPEAYHADFVLRIRNFATPGAYDDWFVDDIFITDGVPDCNNNGVPDDCDITEGTSEDCNQNGIPDECDLDEGISADCNDNGVPDECDIAEGTSIDTNGDYIPDECQDCNNNSVLDPYDIADGTSEDCNANGIPDECDLADGTSNDCDANGVPDECDIASLAYRVDDGTYEAKIGSSTGGGFIWLNQFTVEPGAENIVAISLVWGMVATGTPTTLAIWTDPDHDGDPTNAVLVMTTDSVPSENPGTNQFTTVPVPRTYVGEAGDVFFVGAYLTHMLGEHPASLDCTTPSMQKSWVAFGDNLEDLSANPYPPDLVDNYGFPGNLMIRGHSLYKDCNDNDVLDECDITALTSYDNNLSDIPDECELGSAVDLELVPDAPCYSTGDTVTIEIWMNEAEAAIVGGQFFLDYDQAQLELIDIVPAGPPSPFTEQVYECSLIYGGAMPQCEPAAGTIDYAVGIVPETPGATGSAQMAVITFTALQPICSGFDLLTWRTDEVVRVGTEDNTPLYPLLTHLDVGDITPPTLTVPPDVVTGVDDGEICIATLDPGFATAEDDCADPADITISWQRGDGQLSLTDPYNVADSPIIITWQAEDECGNLSSDVTTITVLLLGDLDYDADVDLADLAQLLAHYGTTSGAVYEDGDLDDDGDVDLSDLAALLSVYGTSCP